jgi:hypothetical protein
MEESVLGKRKVGSEFTASQKRLMREPIMDVETEADLQEVTGVGSPKIDDKTLHLCTFKTPILLIHFLGIFTGFVLWDIFLFPIISTFYDVLIIPYWDAFYCMCYIFF